MRQAFNAQQDDDAGARAIERDARPSTQEINFKGLVSQQALYSSPPPPPMQSAILLAQKNNA